MVLGPVIGAFGEMSDDVKHIADAIATELANEHCSYLLFGQETQECGPTSATNCTDLGAWEPTSDGHVSYSTTDAFPLTRLN